MDSGTDDPYVYTKASAQALNSSFSELLWMANPFQSVRERQGHAEYVDKMDVKEGRTDQNAKSPSSLRARTVAQATRMSAPEALMGAATVHMRRMSTERNRGFEMDGNLK